MTTAGNWTKAKYHSTVLFTLCSKVKYRGKVVGLSHIWTYQYLSWHVFFKNMFVTLLERGGDPASETDMGASILMRDLHWLPAFCIRDCTQTNTCDSSRVPPDAVAWCQLPPLSLLQQGQLRANVSSASSLTVHVSCSDSTRTGFRFPGASSLSPVTKTAGQVCQGVCSKS